MSAPTTETLTDQHQAVGPTIVRDARGYTAGYTIACTCGWQSSELRVLDTDHRTPQVAAIKDHWRHLLGLHKPTEESP